MSRHCSLIAGWALAAGAFSADRTDAAQQLGLDFAAAFDRTPVANSNYGWAFTVTSPIIVDGLGFWDAGSDGLVEKHEVGLWLASVAVPLLIASEDVSNNDSVAVPSSSSTGRWLFSTISPVTLAPGSYIIGAMFRAGSPGASDPFVSDASGLSTTLGVNYGVPREIHDTETLTCPTGFGLNEHHGFFGPNFRVVPEPSAAILSGIGAILLSRRRRDRTSDSAHSI